LEAGVTSVSPRPFGGRRMVSALTFTLTRAAEAEGQKKSPAVA
jgi:hypothetical protein